MLVCVCVRACYEVDKTLLRFLPLVVHLDTRSLSVHPSNHPPVRSSVHPSVYSHRHHPLKVIIHFHSYWHLKLLVLRVDDSVCLWLLRQLTQDCVGVLGTYRGRVGEREGVRTY